MSKWTKEELNNMLEDVVNELGLNESVVEKHGQLGTAPAELVKLVLYEKDLKIRALEANFVDASKSNLKNKRELLLAYEKFGSTDEYWEQEGRMYAKDQIDSFLDEIKTPK